MSLSMKWISGFGLFLLTVQANANSNMSSNGNQRMVRVEIPIERVFAPTQGFDDNDNVEVVVHGMLPNGCYQVAETFIRPLSDGITYEIRQYALRDQNGYCAQNQYLPPHQQMTVPFSKTAALGQLRAAQYRLKYHLNTGAFEYRPLEIAVARVPTMDSMPYANITNALVTDVIEGQDELQVTLTGVLNSSCTEFNDQVEVRRQGDVFVLLPVIKMKQDVVCAQALIPFNKKINLGAAEPGEYLIHVRSMNGVSVNRTFTVLK